MVIETPMHPRSSHPELIQTLQNLRKVNGVTARTILYELSPHDRSDELLSALYTALDALGVIAKTPGIVSFLEKNDPMALKQVELALGLRPRITMFAERVPE